MNKLEHINHNSEVEQSTV